MMNGRKSLAPLLAAATLTFTAAVAQVAGPNGVFDLSWHTCDGGGGFSGGGVFTVEGTIGQSDAGAPLIGGTFEVRGGFWPGSVIPAPECPADVTGDGGVDIDDLVQVIVSWGMCPMPCPPRCAADIVPAATGNCAVNIDDLVAVIIGWGSCP